MAKCSRGKTFAVFVVFHSIVNVFPQIMALSIGNVSLQACYRESFSCEWQFYTPTVKVSPLESCAV